MSFVIVNALVPELTELDARQWEWRRKQCQPEVFGEVFGELCRHRANRVGTAGYERAGQKIRDAHVYAVGLEPRGQPLVEKSMRCMSSI